MHSSYALSSDDFAVERDGAAGSLSDLWPGGYQPGDRLGVVLNQPMDPCGCSNLICGTNTLFYDLLRETKGTGGFFRYADTYLIGVGCEPGDFNQLDVWPMHKFVGVMQPTAEAVLETAFLAAETSGDDTTAVKAASALTFVVGYRLGRLAEGKRWARMPET